MRTASAILFHRLIEVRENTWGAQFVLVDGREVSRRFLGGWTARAHVFALTDDQGCEHRVEIQGTHTGLRMTRALLRVDGRVRQILELAPPGVSTRKCPHCGYSLIGQRARNDQVQCPECGRHTTLAQLGLDSADDLAPPRARDM